jgi:integrase
MPLKVVRRPGTKILWLSGSIGGQRVRESSGTDKPILAEERRAAREAAIYRGATHGVKPTRSFGEAVLHYLKRGRSNDTKRRLNRFLLFLSDTKRETVACGQVDQDLLDEACDALLRPGSSDSTRLREVISPVKAVLRYAAIRGWCAIPLFETVRQGKRRKEWLTPAEAEAIIAASPTHLARTFEFMFCAGPRRAETIALDWQHVQLRYCRATLRDVKARPGDVKDRIVELEPRAVAALGALASNGQLGAVFRRANGDLWHPDPSFSGSQLNRAFQKAAKAAGLDRRVFLHMIRHSWASWHYCVNKNLKKLKEDGGWESLEMADRYAHLAPDSMLAEILAFWGRPTGH